MLETILKPIAEDLETTNNLLKNEFTYITKRTGNISGVEHLLIKTSLRPALVILSSRIFGGNPEKTAVLAVVFQFLYFSSKVHDLFTNEEPLPGIKGSGQMSGDRFYILLGDYFHSRASVILQGSGIRGMTTSLTDIVCQMQEARIQKRVMPGYNTIAQTSHTIIRKESAELLAGCCALGARLAGASADEQENMASYGRNLGMALKLSKENDSLEEAAHYLDKAREALFKIPAQPERAVLEQLIKMVTDSGIKAQRLVG